jgi:hypothetical protein
MLSRKNIISIILTLSFISLAVNFNLLFLNKYFDINIINLIIVFFIIQIIIKFDTKIFFKKTKPFSILFYLSTTIIVINDYIHIINDNIKILLYFLAIFYGYLSLKNETDQKNDAPPVIWSVFLVSILIVILYFVSFFSNFSSHIPINPHIFAYNNEYYSDTYQIFYILENFFFNITNGVNIFSGHDFFIQEYSHFYALWQFPYTLLYSTLRLFLNTIHSFNFLIISIFITSFLSSYLFFRDFFKKEFSILGAILYIIFPYFIGQITIGHVGALYYALFPLIFKSLKDNRYINNWKYSLILGMSFLLIGTTEWHLSYFILLMIAICFTTSIIIHKTKIFRIVKIKPLIILTVLFLLTFIYIFYVKNLNIDNTSSIQQKNIEQTIKYAPKLMNLINKDNLAVALGDTEKLVYLGPLLIFFIIGLLIYRKEIEYKLITIIFFLCSFGINIYPSLYKALFDYFPFFSFNRSPSRFFFIIIPLIIFYILNGFKKINFINKNNRFFTSVFVLLIIPTLFFQINKINFQEQCVEINTVLKKDNDLYSVIIVPILEVNNYRNSYYLNFFTCSNKSVINGYTGFMTNEISSLYTNIVSLNNELSEDILIFLKKNNVRYIIFDKNNDYVEETSWKKNIDMNLIKEVYETKNFIYIEI